MKIIAGFFLNSYANLKAVILNLNIDLFDTLFSKELRLIVVDHFPEKKFYETLQDF